MNELICLAHMLMTWFEDVFWLKCQTNTMWRESNECILLVSAESLINFSCVNHKDSWEDPLGELQAWAWAFLIFICFLRRGREAVSFLSGLRDEVTCSMPTRGIEEHWRGDVIWMKQNKFWGTSTSSEQKVYKTTLFSRAFKLSTLPSEQHSAVVIVYELWFCLNNAESVFLCRLFSFRYEGQSLHIFH